MIRAQDSLVSDCEHHFLLSREDDRLLVELHWDLIQPCYSIQFEFQNIARRLEFLPVSGCRVPSIDRETLVLFLCVHGAKHSWGRLGWVCDVAELIRPERGVVWESVIEQACQLHCVRILHLGLILAEKILAASPPETLLRRIGDDAAANLLAVEVQDRLFREETSESNVDEKWRFFFRARERMRDRVSSCVKRQGSPEELIDSPSPYCHGVRSLLQYC